MKWSLILALTAHLIINKLSLLKMVPVTSVYVLCTKIKYTPKLLETFKLSNVRPSSLNLKLFSKHWGVKKPS